MVFIKHSEKPLFTRAAVEAVKNVFNKKDYTSVQIETLYDLLFCENGKRFEFFGLTAYKEDGGISVTETSKDGVEREVSFYAYLRGNSSIYGGQQLDFGLNLSGETTRAYILSELKKKLSYLERNLNEDVRCRFEAEVRQMKEVLKNESGRGL